MARCEYSCAYLLPIAHTRLRVHRASGIPHALCLERAKRAGQTSRKTCGEIAKLCLWVPANGAREHWPRTLVAVIAGLDPAIHPLREILFKRWIRGSSPRMTTEYVERTFARPVRSQGT